MKSFQFDINDNICITVSGETGTVIGRAEYNHGENNYLIRYKSADGRAVENWWSESSIERVG